MEFELLNSWKEVSSNYALQIFAYVVIGLQNNNAVLVIWWRLLYGKGNITDSGVGVSQWFITIDVIEWTDFECDKIYKIVRKEIPVNGKFKELGFAG